MNILIVFLWNIFQKKSKNLLRDLWLTVIETSDLELKSNLPKLKDEVDKIDVGKLKTIPVDLSKLSNVVNN